MTRTLGGNPTVTESLREHHDWCSGNELSDAMRFTRAKTEREAVVTAIADFNRRQGMAELAEHAGTCPAMMTVDELRAQRWERAVAGAPD